MCGLIAAFNTSTAKKRKNVNQNILDRYEDQHDRGTKGFGIINIKDNFKIDLYRATEPNKFLIDLNLHKASMIVAHHRQPTSTPNKIKQTHPIAVDIKFLKFRYLITHNGVIRNCDKLKARHEELGIVYTTEIENEYYRETTYGCNSYNSKTKYNDSESVAVELALFLERKIDNVEFEGSAAFMIVQIDKKTNKAVLFHYGRHDNPLTYLKENGIIEISSEGTGEDVEPDKIFTMDIKRQFKQTEQDLIFPEKVVSPAVVTTTTYYPENKTEVSIVKGITEGTPIENVPDGKRTTQAGTKPVQSAVSWTAKDQEEVENMADDLGMPKNAEASFDNMVNEMLSGFEDFQMELEYEDSAYLADIEEYLGKMKKTMKRMKGLALALFRMEKEHTQQRWGALHDGIAAIESEKVENDQPIKHTNELPLGTPIALDELEAYDRYF